MTMMMDSNEDPLDSARSSFLRGSAFDNENDLASLSLSLDTDERRNHGHVLWKDLVSKIMGGASLSGIPALQQEEHVQQQSDPVPLPTPTQLPFPRRRLYSAGYVQAGCNPSYFGLDDPALATREILATSVDDTIGTWLTNYLVFVLGIWGYQKYLKTASTTNSNTSVSSLWMARYFLFTGLGYGFAGVIHQVLHREEEIPQWTQVVSLFLSGIGVLSLQYSVVSNARMRQGLGAIFAILLSVATLKDKKEIMGLYFCLSLLVVGFVELAGRKDLSRGLGSWIVLGGGIVQLVLSPYCGDKAYQSPVCFHKCPLPTDPLVFNHNGLFHVLVALGMILQAYPRRWKSSQKERAE